MLHSAGYNGTDSSLLPQLWVYPIKGLRGIPLNQALLTPQGLLHDRSFMICRVHDDGSLERVQLSNVPQCALFEQEVDGDVIRVRYTAPEEPIVPHHPLQKKVLEVPLSPDLDQLERTKIDLHNSLVVAYRVGDEHDEWFTACFGFEVKLVYIGDGKRPVLGTFSPNSQKPQKGWLSSISSYVVGGSNDKDDYWLRFSDSAPYLVATEASLRDVRSRFASGDVEMVKFRPNIVVEGEGKWDEDFWGELLVNDAGITLTKMCNRCSSLNVDYKTGRIGKGEKGEVLKKLMKDRRVDKGAKYSPVFGQYGFLTAGPKEGTPVTVGDSVQVSKRIAERTVYDWPLKKDPAVARYY